LQICNTHNPRKARHEPMTDDTEKSLGKSARTTRAWRLRTPRPVMATEEDTDDIPLVDLSMDPSSVASVIRDACVRHGFFYLANHGVSSTVVDDMHAASRAFFALPETVKRTVLASNDSNNRGWTPLGEETLDPATQSEGDTKEGYYIGREVESSTCDEFGSGPNVWPDEAVTGGLNFKKPMMAYHEALTTVCVNLMPLFAEALGLDRRFFDDKFVRPTATLRPLRYSRRTSDAGSGVLGCGAHSDYGVLTVLWTDGTAGLEILDATTGEWVRLKPVGNRDRCVFVCNVGDLCERWTNGVFKSTVHRVVIDERAAGERHSCAFFWEPEFDTVVEPLPRCVQENPPRKYETTTYGEYILEKYRTTHAGFEKRKKEK